MELRRLNRLAAVAFATTTLVLGVARTARADEFVTATQLYQEARYEEALAVLDRLVDTSPDGAVRSGQNLVAEYRALCLLALNRTEDAERALEPLLTRQPLYDPQIGDAPPRFAAMLARVRARVLPSAIRARYRAAKQSFDERDRVEAERGFRDVLLWTERPEIPLEAHGGLDDIAVLAEGFLTLMASTPATAAPNGSNAPTTSPVPSPTGAQAAATSGASAVPAASTRLAHGDADTQSRAVFGPEDADVEPPAFVRRAVPAWPVSLGSAPFDSRRVIVEVLVGPSGEVDEVELKGSVSPFYDPLLARAAKSWRFRPATRAGAPVSYRKPVIVNVVPNARIAQAP